MTHLNQDEFNSKTIDFIKDLQSVLKPKHQYKVAEALGLSKLQLRDFLEGKLRLDPLQFSNLSKEFNFSLKAFNEDRVDFNAIKNSIYGNKSYLPEKYTEGKFYKNFMLTGTLDFIGAIKGSGLKQVAYNHLQIGESIFKNPLEDLSIYAMDDLIYFLSKNGVRDDDFKNMGQFVVNHILNAQAKSSLKEFPDPFQFLPYYAEEFVNQNMLSFQTYNVLKNIRGQFLVEAITSPLMVDFIKSGAGSVVNYCLQLEGGLKAVCWNLKVPMAKVSHSKCILRGDSQCIFEVAY